MVGETLLSANSTTGLYLLIDNNGWVGNNTPGTCNLGGSTGLVLGTGYMYFDDFTSLKRSSTTPNTEGFVGWTFGQGSSTYLRTNGFTGQAIFSGLEFTAMVDSTQQQNFERFFDIHQAVGNYQLYLVRQWASTTFRQFSYNATLYQYIAVILTNYDIAENGQQGKDVQTLRAGLVHAYRINTTP